LDAAEAARPTFQGHKIPDPTVVHMTTVKCGATLFVLFYSISYFSSSSRGGGFVENAPFWARGHYI